MQGYGQFMLSSFLQLREDNLIFGCTGSRENYFGSVDRQNNKQILHAFLFNMRNYSPEVINIQQREAELDIVLPRVSNFDIKQKKAWNISFIICHQHQARSGKIKANKTQQISVKTQVFFVKTEL